MFKLHVHFATSTIVLWSQSDSIRQHPFKMYQLRNWGLYYPDQTSVYNVDFTGRGSVDVNTGGNLTNGNGIGSGNGNGSLWSIVSSNANEKNLRDGLDWACGSENVDCSPIQPSQPCFEPDSFDVTCVLCF
ncbi:hypothetical protein L1887_38149 [Cichorium endivia]|nr:hypothetical protein L1887_38149 [Cichorium endivia]